MSKPASDIFQAKATRHKACEDCGYIHHLPKLSAGEQLNCFRCGSCLLKERKDWSRRSLALSLTGLILFGIANVFPFIGLEAAGLHTDSNLISSVYALLQRERWVLASMIFLFIFLIPFVELCCLVYLAISYALGSRVKHYRARGIPQIMRTVIMIHPWSMLEIFLLGVLVTSIKLGDIAALVPGIGSVAFVLLVLVLVALHMQLNPEHIWHRWNPNNLYLHRDQKAEKVAEHIKTNEFISCHCCEALISEPLARHTDKCPRCHCKIHFRIPGSIEKSFALLLAAIILYLPANILPIIETTQLGRTQADTIMSGVIHLIHLGSWPIALIIFIASVFVPIAKIVTMGYLLYSAKYGGSYKIKNSTKMYRITEFIGRWSMIDVFVVCLLVALVQFGLLANIEPSGATLAFASVVVLTMLAAEIFDQRLLWDKHNESAQ